MIYGELISANNSAFLTKKIEGELNRIDEVCSVPKQDLTDETLSPDGFAWPWRMSHSVTVTAVVS